MSRTQQLSPRSRFRPRLEILEDRTLLSFGTDGIAVTSLGGDDRAWAGALQPDGKIIAAGYSQTNGSGTGTDFALVRWNPDGRLDTGFGQGGKVITNMSSPSSGSDRIWGVSLQADGKIVASGEAANNRGAVALARYNSNGTLDASFGNNGKVFTSGASGRGNVIQPDGKVVVVGTSGDFAIFRYNTNGALDNSFGNKGKVFTDFGGNDLPEAVSLQADGKIVVAGRRFSGDQDIALARYNSNGSLDTSFGSGGKVITDLGPGSDRANAVAIQSDGKIVVAGTLEGDSQFAVVRYNVNGSLDSTFNGDGIVTVDFSPADVDEAYAVAIQPDGKIVVGGIGGNEYFALARLNSNGSLDATFGTGGKVATDLNPGGWHDFVSSLFIQPADQKIVAVGSRDGEVGFDFAAARYNPDGSLDAGAALQAPGTPAGGSAGLRPLTPEVARPLLTEALVRWQAAGVATSGLSRLSIQITDLGGRTLGMASRQTIWLDDNAAGWGWFVDSTPGNDSEFTTPGNQGEQGRMDLLTVVMHEMGHVLGLEHEENGVMAETLAAGTRHAAATGNTIGVSPFDLDVVLAIALVAAQKRRA